MSSSKNGENQPSTMSATSRPREPSSGFVAVGLCCIDTILTVDSFPIEDQKHQASQLQKRGGGNVRNLLEVFQQLPQDEVPLTLLAALPAEDSWETKFIQESVTNVGFLGSSVDFSHAFYRESVQNAPSSFQIRNAAAGTRTGVRYNGVEDMSLEEFKEAADRISNEIRLYHFEGRNTDVTLKCIHYLREMYPKIKISVEAERPEQKGLQEIAKVADVVFYSQHWAQDKGYKSAEDCLLSQKYLTKKAEYLCCTWGSSGASLYQVSKDQLHSVPAFKLKQAGSNEPAAIVDTIGAGDTFTAGILFGLYFTQNRWTARETLEFANELAGRKVCQEGYGGLGDVMMGENW